MSFRELETRTCAAKGCQKTFRVWPASSQAFYCCLLHSNEPMNQELKRPIFKSNKSDYQPTFGQYGGYHYEKDIY